MNKQKKKMFLIKLPYWLGIAADAFWAVILLFPELFSMLTGSPDFNVDLQTRLIMAVGGILMTGWTCLLFWAVRNPVERRFVILLTAFPVVFGLFIISLIELLQGNNFYIWIVVKTAILFITMVTSYSLSETMKKK